MKAELLDYIAAHSAPSRLVANAHNWRTPFLVVGHPTRDEVVSRLLATSGMEILLDGRWHDALQVVDLIGPEMTIRLLLLGEYVKAFEVSTPIPNVLAFRAIGRFRPMFGKEAVDPIRRFAHVSG